jgi:DNA polymerase-3 subunit alpha
MFERFLSVNRKGWADVDLDFEASRRWEMQQYAFERFGKDNCAFISTFGIRKAKSALKAAGRLLKISLDVIDEISKAIPFAFYDDEGEKNVDPTLSEHLAVNKDLQAYQQKYPELFETALQIESFPCAMGVHAAGIIIGNSSLMDKLPLKIYHDKAHDIDSVATTITKEQVERFRLKYDFLALRTLSIVDKTLADVGKTFNFTDNMFNDEAVWEMIGSSNTDGMFQIASDIYKARMPRLKPKSISELAACLALVRAPSISAKTDEVYMRVCEGKQKAESLCQEYDWITRDTNGVVIFQEQVLQLGVAFGLSIDDAYALLKAISKKKLDKVAAMKDIFYANAKNKGMNIKIVDRIWSIIESAALYSFNMGHATAYALVTYASAWLKVHYTQYFMANLLTNVYTGSNDRKIRDAVKNCKNLKIDFLPPNINKSSWEFTVEEDKIRIGFCAIKSLGYTAALDIVEHQEYMNLEDFYNKVNKRVVNKKIVDVLILSGCFGPNRQEIFTSYYTLKKEEVPSVFSPCKGVSLNLTQKMKQVEKVLCKENLYY